jgi:hypothetical protein
MPGTLLCGSCVDEAPAGVPVAWPVWLLLLLLLLLVLNSVLV